MTSILFREPLGNDASTARKIERQTSRIFEPFSIIQTVERVGEGAVEKVQHPTTHFMRSLVGGAMVGFGVLLAFVLSAGVKVSGLSSLLMGVAFGPSFALICVSGMSLISADMATGVIPLMERIITPVQYLRFLLIGLVGNLAGVFVFIGVTAVAGGPYLSDAFVQKVVTVGTTKAGEDVLGGIFLGILCTWFLQTAMFMYYKARTDIARMTFAFYGPFAFVSAGTQHVIANIGFPWLLHLFHPNTVGSTLITWGFGSHGMARNLCISFVGNWIGGALCVALPFYLIAKTQVAETRGDHGSTRWWPFPRSADI